MNFASLFDKDAHKDGNYNRFMAKITQNVSVGVCKSSKKRGQIKNITIT
jgi:hypothetical protein